MNIPMCAFHNKKGGVGKTTTLFHLAGELARRGRRVLAIDLDFQANLTSILIGSEATLRLAPNRTTAAIAADADLPYAPDLILSTRVAGVDLIPGSLAAETLDLADPEALPPRRQARLRDMLYEVADYDHVFFDCHPSGSLMAWFALMAATHCLIPVIPELPGALGMGPMLGQVERARRLNPALSVIGVMVNKVDARVGNHGSWTGAIRDEYGDLVFATTLGSRNDFSESFNVSMPVTRFRPKGAAAVEMAAFAGEFEARLEARRVPGEVLDVQG
jgi:chromosome partitioning protein